MNKQELPGGLYPPLNQSTPIAWDEQFHTFAVEWSPGVIAFEVDGNVYETVTGASAVLPTAPMYWILNTAVAWYLPVDPSRYPATHVIDAVHVWQCV